MGERSSLRLRSALEEAGVPVENGLDVAPAPVVGGIEVQVGSKDNT